MTNQGVPLPPVGYRHHEYISPDTTLRELPFGAAASSALSNWLSCLPGNTQIPKAKFMSQWQGLSWTAFHILLSDLVAETEAHIGMAGHSFRVSHMALRCGVALGLQPLALSELFWGGAFHDIGKMSMDQAILSKPSALTSEDWQLVRQHPVEGFDTLMQVLNNRAIAEIALTHHEHWDGNGYPSGLSGEAIPLQGRIMAVADTFDALTTPRAYKKAVREDIARRILEDEAGRQFDPSLVRRLLDGGILHHRDPGVIHPDFG